MTPLIAEQVRAVQIAHHANREVPDFPRIEKVVKRLCQQPPGRLLDVGYAPRSFADTLAARGWQCTGIDLNSHRPSSVCMIQADLNQGLPVASQTFDVVTAGEVIEHLIDEGAFLQECHRVLTAGGTLVLTTPNLTFSVNRLLVLMGKMPRFVYAPYHYHAHTKQTITQLLEGHGFHVEQVISSHLLYSRRRHWTGRIFEWLGDLFPTFGAHLIVFAKKRDGFIFAGGGTAQK